MSLTGKYNRLVSDTEASMKKMKVMIDKLEQDNANLVNQLDEERK